MITKEQVNFLAKKYKISEAVVFREYLQILFLAKLYQYSQSRRVFFKGGTAIHLIFGSPRFSEDLDFTVELSKAQFEKFIKQVFKSLKKEEGVFFKERKTIAGKRYLLTGTSELLDQRAFVNLDFSFREKIIQKEKSAIVTDYPVIFTSFVCHLSKEEILAEKIRAILTREKGRDLYDLWYLVSKQATTNKGIILKKLKHYRLERVTCEEIIGRVSKFSKEKFVLDLRPFVPVPERKKLSEFFDYIKEFLKQNLVLEK